MDSCANFRECPFVGFHARSRKPWRSWIHGVKFSKWRTSRNHADASAFHKTQTKIFLRSEPWGIRAKYWYNNSLCDIFTYRNDFASALGVQHRNLSIAIVLNYVRVAYVNLIATGIVFNIRASSSHIGRMMPFSEHRRGIISVFDRRSIMNRLYWHDQQVGYVCFVPSVWEQRGVIAAVADQTAMISHLLPMCWATRGGSWRHVMMWARFGSQGSIALNWHSRYSGTRYSGTWLY